MTNSVNSVNRDENEPSHLDLHCLHSLFWSAWLPIWSYMNICRVPSKLFEHKVSDCSNTYEYWGNRQILMQRNNHVQSPFLHFEKAHQKARPIIQNGRFCNNDAIPWKQKWRWRHQSLNQMNLLCHVTLNTAHFEDFYEGPAKRFVTGFGLLQCYVLSNIFLYQTFKVSPLYWNTLL